jgi:transglutaminase-like putative cysteine protease
LTTVIFATPYHMKKILTLVAFILAAHCASSQDFPFGTPSFEELQMKRYEKDTSASAVVLREYGTTFINSTNIDVVFEYHVRIKVFNSKGYKKGNVELPIHKSDANTFEQINDLKAVTIYPGENGKFETTELEKKQVFKETGKYRDLLKFAMPNVVDGAIIEYTYTLQSPFIFNFKSWDFQSDIPKIHSEYCARIPAVYNYNIVLRGGLKLAKNTAEIEKGCFAPDGWQRTDCSKMTYIMTDVPAFIEEDYMTAPSNFLSAVYFELSYYYDYRGNKFKVTKEWADVDKELKTHANFGVQLKKTDVFASELQPVVSGKPDPLEKAKAIYSYIQGWYKWNNYYGKYSDDGLKKSHEKHSGNVGDINLALVTAMRSAGFDAAPVILSTRDNGTVNPLFPVLSDFNYVICKLNVGGNPYLLDATDPLLPFGLLPLRCFNDKGRIMNFQEPSAWLDIKASQSERQTVRLLLNIEESGKTKGNAIILSSGYEAYNKRKAIKKFNSIDEYVENLDERYPRVKFINSKISDLDSLEKPVTESFELDINSADNGLIHINPFFLNKIAENPFKLTERLYPVDLGAPIDTRITMQLKFPESMEVVSKPQSLALALPNNGGKVITQTSLDGNSILLTYRFELTKSVYTSDEYYYLKELYNKIIDLQQTDITLRKKL